MLSQWLKFLVFLIALYFANVILYINKVNKKKKQIRLFYNHSFFGFLTTIVFNFFAYVFCLTLKIKSSAFILIFKVVSYVF